MQKLDKLLDDYDFTIFKNDFKNVFKKYKLTNIGLLNDFYKIFNKLEHEIGYSIYIYLNSIQQYQVLSNTGKYREEDLCKWFQELIDSEVNYLDKIKYTFRYFLTYAEEVNVCILTVER